MAATTPALVRPTLVWVRGLLYVGAALAFIAGVQLFVLSEATDRYFAWTISPPLTAAFLGAAYWAGTVLAFLAAREPVWARARASLGAVLVFSTGALAATLLHLDRFHLDSIFGWVWLAVYVLLPPAVLILFVLQGRVPGGDAPRVAPMPSWVRAAIGGQAALLLGVGVAFFVAPQAFAGPAPAVPLWPWTLTPLTARAVAFWLLGLGVAAALALRENDWARVRAPAVSYVTFALLELIALARYPATIAWADARGWLLVLFLLSVLLVGLYSWRATVAARRP